ncbi:hypothetical protein D3C71_1490510 [compost metagenome]
MGRGGVDIVVIFARIEDGQPLAGPNPGRHVGAFEKATVSQTRLKWRHALVHQPNAVDVAVLFTMRDREIGNQPLRARRMNDPVGTRADVPGRHEHFGKRAEVDHVFGPVALEPHCGASDGNREITAQLIGLDAALKRQSPHVVDADEIVFLRRDPKAKLIHTFDGFRVVTAIEPERVIDAVRDLHIGGRRPLARKKLRLGLVRRNPVEAIKRVLQTINMQDIVFRNCASHRDSGGWRQQGQALKIVIKALPPGVCLLHEL